MNPQRARAYGRVIERIRDCQQSRLLEAEQQRIREAADTLLFCEGEPSSTEVGDIGALVQSLVDSARWSQATAEALVCDLVACGPVP